MLKLTIEEFIIRAKKVHGDKYSYSLSEYVNTRTKIKIICPIHNIFEQLTKNHLSGYGCDKCSGTVKLTTTEFINKAKEIHGNKYEYSLVKYFGNNINVNITCRKHKKTFKQIPSTHLKGHGCPDCGVILGIKKRTTDILDFIIKSELIHENRYDYSLVNYTNARTKVKIICPVHNAFEQIPNSHLNGKGCCKCGGTAKSTKEEFIERAISIHENKYNYSLVNYINSTTKVKIICPIHGEFKQNPSSHINMNNGCPKCKESKGEKTIRNFLEALEIVFKQYYKFVDCKDKIMLIFDFYLPQHNICIEFDGIQHFKPIKSWGGIEGLIGVQRRDRIKTNYCLDKQIELIRISFKDDINIELNRLLHKLNLT